MTTFSKEQKCLYEQKSIAVKRQEKEADATWKDWGQREGGFGKEQRTEQLNAIIWRSCYFGTMSPKKRWERKR